MAHEGHAHDSTHAHHASSVDAAQPLNLTRPDLPAGSGEAKLLFLDAPSGLAGDMTIAALVDLGVPTRVVELAVFALPLRGFHLHFSSRVKSGIVATHFEVHLSEPQPERTYGSIRDMLDSANLDPAVRARAQRIFRRLAESESKVHRMPIDDVHFHEVGAVDAIVDVVGASAALAHLGARVVVSPLPMGRGFVNARHGVLPLPPPAVVECLRGFDTYDGGIAFELVTPTGAAIVAGSAESSARWPSMRPVAIGWGAGSADLADRPNLLRVVLGDAVGEALTSHSVLEANLDDATGELAARAIEVLLRDGAIDAWATPITMKKGRPALTLSAIVPISLAGALAATLLRETTSLGVRHYEVSRVERPRKIVETRTKYGIIRVKVGEGPFGPSQIKPEFDDCARAAELHGVPVREVIRAALVAYG